MHNKPEHITLHSSPINNDGAFFMATTPRRTVKTPGATETPTEQAELAVDQSTENTTSTVSEPVAEVVADQTQEQPTPESTEQAEPTQTLPDDYEEYLAWKNSRAKQAEEPTTTVVATPLMGAADSTLKRKRPVLGPKGWTQEEY